MLPRFISPFGTIQTFPTDPPKKQNKLIKRTLMATRWVEKEMKYLIKENDRKEEVIEGIE